MESDSDSNDDSAITAKQAVQKMKTISKDKSLLVPETLSGQVEYDAHHRAKLSGVTDIQQSIVTSSPDAKTKFGQTQVQTKLSEYLEKVQTLPTGSGNTSVSAAQVLKGFTIPKKDPASNVHRRKMTTRRHQLNLMTKGLRFLRGSPIEGKRNLMLKNIERSYRPYTSKRARSV